MAERLETVEKWRGPVEDMIREYGLGIEPWVVLAIIHVESKGYARPESVFGDISAAEGLLQITPIAARDAGVSISNVDGLGEPYYDGIRSLDVFGTLAKRYVHPHNAVWDYPLFWLSGSGTLQTQREYLDAGWNYWPAWWEAAADSEAEAVTVSYVYDYAVRWLDASIAYYQSE